jgi:predicted nuclease of predicted toxin-antitoxin system
VIDANLPRSLSERLRQLGYQVWDVRDIGLGVADDGTISAYAIRIGAILISRDLDFADVRNYPLRASPGRIIVGFPSMTRAEVITAVVGQFASNGELVALASGALTIVEPGRVRFKREEP